MAIDSGSFAAFGVDNLSKLGKSAEKPCGH